MTINLQPPESREATTPPATTQEALRGRRPPKQTIHVVRTVILTAVVLSISVLWIYPFIWMVSASIKSPEEIFGGLGLFPEVIRLDNYIRAWTEANIGRYFFNTVFVAVVSVIISVVTTAMLGYILGRFAFPGKRIVFAAFAAAIFLPEGYTIIPIFDLLNRLGLNTSLWGLALAEAGGAHVVAVLLFAGYFRQLPAELAEAARMDGAGFFRVFAQIYLPLAKPVTATAIILQFMHSWNDFLLPLVLTLPRPEMRTLAVGVYSFTGEHFTDWGAMAAASTIALLPIIVVFLFLQRYFVESVAGAMKG